LAAALRILGYKTLHHAPERLPLCSLNPESFRVYDDVGAVCDAPASFFYEELVGAYGGLKLILTVRDIDAWWHSLVHHVSKIAEGGSHEHIEYTQKLHGILFGWPAPHKYLYQRAFRRHNEYICRSFQPSQLLVLDITAGDGWSPLCDFLSEPVPDRAFPWRNRLHTAECEQIDAKTEAKA